MALATELQTAIENRDKFFLELLKESYFLLQVAANKKLSFAVQSDGHRADLRNVISMMTGKSSEEIQNSNEIKARKNG